MATDLKITLDNLPGELARLGETLGNAGVNIEGIVGVTAGDKGEIHVVVEDADAATAALSAAGITVDAAREVAVTSCNDAPGELGRVARRL
ncbi:MAG TPA: ACT domain-containing protein, partial [Acidimicrobiia bacterium]|nr:ACT domain-containing protein [Acidimicrobiia bacterium]